MTDLQRHVDVVQARSQSGWVPNRSMWKCLPAKTGRGDLLYVQSRSVRHGSPEVLARLGRGEQVDAGAYTFRTSTRIETAASELDWLNKGVFISVAGRQAGGVIYETYLVR